MKYLDILCAVVVSSLCGWITGAGLASLFLFVLSGCAPLLGENKQTELISIERYDPETGKPMKICEIIDDRPIKVKFLDENGKPIVKMLKLSGGMYTPPPLPKPVNAADAAVLDQYIKDWREGKTP